MLAALTRARSDAASSEVVLIRQVFKSSSRRAEAASTGYVSQYLLSIAQLSLTGRHKASIYRLHEVQGDSVYF